MNILDKTDQSTLPAFGRPESPLCKLQHYKWDGSSQPGRFQLIEKADLNIDGEYQREKVSDAKVLNIARGWDWRLFGVISVTKRPDGTFWVYDGGHRTRASFLRSDVTALPCMVFEAATKSDEAKAFVGTNTMKSNVSSFSQYKAGVVAGEPGALAIKAMVEGLGLTVDGTGGNGRFCAVNTLRKMIAKDHQLAEATMTAAVEIANGEETVSGLALYAMFYAARRLQKKISIFSGRPMERLMEVGIRGIEVAVRREANLAGKGGEAVNAKAVLEIINKGLHRKIKFPSAD